MRWSRAAFFLAPLLLSSACQSTTTANGGDAAIGAGGAVAGTGGAAGAAAGSGGNGGAAGTAAGSGGAPTDAGVDGGTDAGTPQPFKGVANADCADLTTLGVSWWYNWTTGPGSCKVAGFVPMIWGHTGSEQTGSWITSTVAGFVNAGQKHVLGFNEPDNSGQANMPVATAIALWPSFNNPGIKIGSPATSANAAGQTWFKDFMSQVNADTTGTLRVDFIAAHWYGWNAGSCDASATTLESYIKMLEGIPGGRPIWLTEWGCLNQSNPDEATVQAFYSGALKMFARHPRVERYAWYQWTTNNHLVSSGALTALGTVFAAAPATR